MDCGVEWLFAYKSSREFYLDFFFSYLILPTAYVQIAPVFQ